MDLNLGYTQKIIAEAAKRGVLRNALAYILATAYWETGRTMKPVKEAYWLSEDWRKKNLRYYPWYGRGFVQLTWEDNYKFASDKVGKDLTKNADLALDPDIACQILVQGMIEGWFAKDKQGVHNLDRYFNTKNSKWLDARRIINGIDKKNEIADIAMKYNEDLKKAGYGVDGNTKWQTSPSGAGQGSIVTEKPVQSVSDKKATNLLEVILELLRSIFGGSKK